MMRSQHFAIALVTILAAACGDDSMPGTDGGMMGNDSGMPGTDGGPRPDTGPVPDGGTPITCPAVGDRMVVTVSADITADATWTCDNLYQLAAPVYVIGATLTIQPGTVVQGTAGANALIITTTGSIDAQGTATDPIVFTSANPEGTREPGNWGGVVLLGLAPINVPGGTNGIEGLDPSESRGQYGGTDVAHDCGTLRYVRVEFAGFVFGKDNELNGLTIGGCGSGTTLEYIQSHHGLDDGIEFFGGTANISHFVVSQTGDDGLDWDQGWSGNAQFFACQQDNSGERCIEADNREAERDAMPRSNPTLWNITLVGRDQANQQGMRLRHGTAGEIHNAVLQGFGMTECVRVDGTPTILQANMGELLVADSVLDGCGGDMYFRFTADMGDTTTMFTGDWASMSTLGMDAMLGDPGNLDEPDFVPAAGSPAGDAGGTPNGDFFDATATYAGAFAPGGADWTAGWTAYPAD